MSSELDQSVVIEGELKQEKTDRENMDQDKVNIENMEQEKMDQENMDQEKMDQEKTDQEKMDQEKMDQEKTDQEKMDQEKTDQEKMDQEKTDEEKMDQEKTDEEKMDQEKTDEENMDQKEMDECGPIVLLTEDQIKKEDDDIICISDEEEDLSSLMPIPIPSIPIGIPILTTAHNSFHEIRERSFSEPLSFEGCLSEDVTERQCFSAMEVYKNCDGQIITISDSDSETSIEHRPKKILKRKRSLIPSFIEVENSRKTMKPGPKSKTRNMVTVHQMISEAKMLESGVTLDSSDSDDDCILDESEEDNDSSDYENESNEEETDPNEGVEEEAELSKIDLNDEIISVSSTDNTDHLELEIGEIITGCESSTSSNDAALLSNNVTTNRKVSETLNDKNNETEILENVIDSNKLVNDNKALENNVDDKKENITEDENFNNEILKNSLIDSNEVLKGGE